MKRILSLVLVLVMAFVVCSCGKKPTTETQNSTESVKVEYKEDLKTGDFSLTAQDVCYKMGAGWNLGNTLDACQIWGDISDAPTVLEQETGWNNPKTTQEIIDFVVKSGFGAIRIPVTWYLQVEEKNGEYVIKDEWMARVKEVAEYCLKNDVYTIVNMHHDDQFWLNISADENEWEQIKIKYSVLWKQIATAFKDYNDKLILEGLNEVTATVGFDGCEGDENGKCWWGHSEEVFHRLNQLYQIFVDTVRETGGNNTERYLMLPTYGAQWYDNQINNVNIPNDDGHIILDVHWYQPDAYNKDSNAWVFSAMRKFADEHGIGAVLGESGRVKSASTYDKESYGKNVVGGAAEYGIPVFLWDDGGDVQILERDKLKWNCKEYIDSVIENSKLMTKK